MERIDEPAWRERFPPDRFVSMTIAQMYTVEGWLEELGFDVPLAASRPAGKAPVVCAPGVGMKAVRTRRRAIVTVQRGIHCDQEHEWCWSRSRGRTPTAARRPHQDLCGSESRSGWSMSHRPVDR